MRIERIDVSYWRCRTCGKAQRRDVTKKMAALPGNMLYDKLRSCLPRISILVWGADPRSEFDIARKRLDVRRALETEGHTVYFSEDLEFPPGSPIPLNIQERIQQVHVKFVVNVVGLPAETPGALGETHEFGVDLGRKMLLWLPSKARAGFIGSALARELRLIGAPPEYYEAEHVSSCVIALASVDWIQGLLAMHWSATQDKLAAEARDPLNW